MTEPTPKSSAQAIVIVGDIATGFRFIGPFHSADDAHAIIARNHIAHARVADLTPGDERIGFAFWACRALIDGKTADAQAYARLAVEP